MTRRVTTVGKTKKSGATYRAHWSRKPTEKDVVALENVIEAAKDQMARLRKAEKAIVKFAIDFVDAWTKGLGEEEINCAKFGMRRQVELLRKIERE